MDFKKLAMTTAAAMFAASTATANPIYNDATDPEILIKGKTTPEQCVVTTLNAIGIPGATIESKIDDKNFSINKSAQWLFAAEDFDDKKHTLSNAENEKWIYTLENAELPSFPEGNKVDIGLSGEYNKERKEAYFRVLHDGSAFKPPSPNVNNGYDAISGEINFSIDKDEKTAEEGKTSFKIKDFVPSFSSGVVMAHDHKSNLETPSPNWVLANTEHGQWVDKTIANIHKIFGNCLKGEEGNSIEAESAPMSATYGQPYNQLHRLQP